MPNLFEICIRKIMIKFDVKNNNDSSLKFSNKIFHHFSGHREKRHVTFNNIKLFIIKLITYHQCWLQIFLLTLIENTTLNQFHH